MVLQNQTTTFLYSTALYATFGPAVRPYDMPQMTGTACLTFPGAPDPGALSGNGAAEIGSADCEKDPGSCDPHRRDPTCV